MLLKKMKKKKKKNKRSQTSKPQALMIHKTIRSFAMDRAHDIQAKLSSEFPSFLKPVHRSNVAGRFCLYLPKLFCDDHLPNRDETITLVDENDQEFHVNYVLLRNKLDGGWRGFANVHKLVEGDAMVFHLVEHCKFKVYIVRAATVNGTRALPNSSSYEKPIDTEQLGRSNIPEDVQSKSIVSVKDKKCFDDFQIQMDGQILDLEMPRRLRRKYYELCCSQDMFLHENLTESLNSKLVVGMISETTNIAEAIRVAKLTASHQNLKCWDKTLEALEVLGMEVKFLRVRLHKLIELGREFKVITELSRKKRAQLEDEDLRDLRATFVKAKVLVDGIEAEVEALEVKRKKLKCDFEEIASAPW